MLGLKSDWLLEPQPRTFVIDDYQGAQGRWCPGCGDFSVLNSVQRLCRDEQLPPEKTVFVSGIGCSSRFPHYMKTFGFHGLHGRAFPVACGIRSRRPDLNIFVATGDGDCCSIGTAHWIHALRYNMKMVVMLFDNHIYGLTKKQTSPTTPKGSASNTHPDGAWLSAVNPINVSLGVENASFVAQTIDWNPPHLFATLKRAFHHPGFAFVRILQRCPHFMPQTFTNFQSDPGNVLLMTHEQGVDGGPAVEKAFKNHFRHDPGNRDEGFELAGRGDVIPIGLFYYNDNAERYDQFSKRGIGIDLQTKIEAIEQEIDRFKI